ncbi:TolC family protein [Paraburkholderia ultramafica]|uniref:TolC family protein n=1 Tax=Paraburkholderia ultramafica TaxID=1544867 RepID=UPI001582D694|nr:TolC family protein [Paraburkholderia ultramafica]
MPEFLPTTDQAIAWIDAEPSVSMARNLAEAASYGGAAVKASPYEWTTTLQGQRRRYQDTGLNSNEFNVQIERTIRIVGKAGLDRQLGDLDARVGRAKFVMARHETAQALSAMWISLIVAKRQLNLLNEQMGFAASNVEAVKRRKRAGDASTLEVNLAQADLGEVKRQASNASTDLSKSRAALLTRFPSAEPGSATLPEPRPPVWQEAEWRERIVAASDAMQTAQGEWEKSQLTAQRVRADRIPDPTIGIFAGTEARRNEKIIGVSVSIPLSGTYRAEKARQAGKEMDAALSSLDRARIDSQLEAMQTYSEAKGSFERWRIATESADLAEQNAQMTQRAYLLGETDLQSLLLAQRQSLEASRAAIGAQGDAVSWEMRMLIDAHLIWNLALD